MLPNTKEYMRGDKVYMFVPDFLLAILSTHNMH
jgi:hypothetical protein